MQRISLARMSITPVTCISGEESIICTVFLPVLNRHLDQELTQDQKEDKKHLHWDPRESVSVQILNYFPSPKQGSPSA